MHSGSMDPVQLPINSPRARQADSRHRMLRRRSLLKQAAMGRRIDIRAGKGDSREKSSEKKNTENARKQKTRHKRQKRLLALSLDCARQVRHRRLQPTRNPCQKHYRKCYWAERKHFVLSRSFEPVTAQSDNPIEAGVVASPKREKRCQ